MIALYNDLDQRSPQIRAPFAGPCRGCRDEQRRPHGGRAGAAHNEKGKPETGHHRRAQRMAARRNTTTNDRRDSPRMGGRRWAGVLDLGLRGSRGFVDDSASLI